MTYKNRRKNNKKSKKNPIKIISITLFLLLWIFSVYINNSQNNIFKPKLLVENIITQADKDWDWINDIDDILAWARTEVKNKTIYKDGYFSGGYPPVGQWVCTDVIWRAFKEAWYDLKYLVDSDIKNNIWDYSRVNWSAEPNIDFRRVPNLQVYFEKYAKVLTQDVIPGNINNLSEWQPWDIVTFWAPKNHIAIISDKRNTNWVPFIIHNSAPTAREDDWLVYWNENVSSITGHYRLKY